MSEQIKIGSEQMPERAWHLEPVAHAVNTARGKAVLFRTLNSPTPEPNTDPLVLHQNDKPADRPRLYLVETPAPEAEHVSFTAQHTAEEQAIRRFSSRLALVLVLLVVGASFLTLFL